jgi:hypothetical protein
VGSFSGNGSLKVTSLPMAGEKSAGRDAGGGVYVLPGAFKNASVPALDVPVSIRRDVDVKVVS